MNKDQSIVKRMPPIAWKKPVCFVCLAGAAALTLPGLAEPEKTPPAPTPDTTIGTNEARARAQLLHTAINGALQVMHRDFFHRNGSKAIPSKSLDEVFKVLGEERSVKVHWLAADETLMNKDNKARDAFERKAIASITGGEKEVEAEEAGVFRFAGAITLQNECLKCHVPDRNSLEDRHAALVISIPLGTGK